MTSGIRRPNKMHACIRSRVPAMRPPVRIARRALPGLVMDDCAIVAVIRFFFFPLTLSEFYSREMKSTSYRSEKSLSASEIF